MTSWVRLWVDMPTDPKWRVIARKSGQPLPCVIAMYTILMTTAGCADQPGGIDGFSVEEAAAALDMDEDAVSSIIDAMQDRVIAEGRLSGWERRQPKREDDSSARVAAHRKRKSEKVKRDVTQGNAPEAEAEAEAELAVGGAGEGEIIGWVGDIARAAGLASTDTGRIAEQNLIVRGWINAGADRDTILKAIERALPTAKSPPRFLKYFDGAVRDAIAGTVKADGQADALIAQAARYRKAAA